MFVIVYNKTNEHNYKYCDTSVILKYICREIFVLETIKPR